MQTEPHFRCLLKMDQEMNQDANPRGMLCNQLNEARSTHVLKRIVVFGKLKISIYKNVHFRFEYLYVRTVLYTHTRILIYIVKNVQQNLSTVVMASSRDSDELILHLLPLLGLQTEPEALRCSTEASDELHTANAL